MRARQGTVVAFDAARGIGSIAADGGEVHRFHSAEIADGTRSIEVGVRVRFRVLPKLGAWEAASVEPV